MAEDDYRSRALYDAGGATAAAARAAIAEGLACPPPKRPGETPIDLVVGLTMRLALAAQFATWTASNAAERPGPLDPGAWLAPAQGLREAAQIWTMGQMDPGLAAAALLATAGLLALSLALGLLARLSGALVMAGAAWHIVFVLPEAWPSTLAYGAMGLYLALRGAGPASADWLLARLARIG